MRPCVLPRQLGKQINQPAVAVHRQIAVPIRPPCVGVLRNGNGLCPLFVVRREPPVPILLPDGNRQHIQDALMPELLRHLRDGFPVQEYTIHIAAPLYPDPTLDPRQQAEDLRARNFAVWKQIYEKTYGIPLVYRREEDDLGAVVVGG